MWAKGQSGNPRGRPKTAPIFREFREKSYQDFIASLRLYGSENKAQIQARLDDPETPMFQRIFLTMVQRAEFDHDYLKTLLERLWGKVKDEVRVENVNPVREELQALSVVDLMEIIRSCDAAPGQWELPPP